MSYTKITTSFKDHETVLTAAHLQHMENGIADNDAALVNRVRTVRSGMLGQILMLRALLKWPPLLLQKPTFGAQLTLLWKPRLTASWIK